MGMSGLNEYSCGEGQVDESKECGGEQIERDPFFITSSSVMKLPPSEESRTYYSSAIEQFVRFVQNRLASGHWLRCQHMAVLVIKLCYLILTC